MTPVLSQISVPGTLREGPALSTQGRQHGLQTLSVRGQTGPLWGRKDWLAGRGTTGRSCCPRGTRSSRSPLLGCPSVAQVTLFPSPPSVPSGRHLLSPAGKGQHRLMLLQSSRHRGECVLGAAACYKYTSESENQRPPTRQPVCPAAPRSGVQALPSQPRAAYFPSQAHLTKAGWMGKKEINAPKFAVASLEGF